MKRYDTMLREIYQNGDYIGLQIDEEENLDGEYIKTEELKQFVIDSCHTDVYGDLIMTEVAIEQLMCDLGIEFKDLK